jgi:hypothetical protein
MQASIYKPTKTTMQSGTRNSEHWLLEFDHDGSRKIEPVMGWVSSQDMLQEVSLKFSNKETAIAFANKNNIEYEVVDPQQKKFVKQAYADNFK